MKKKNGVRVYVYLIEWAVFLSCIFIAMTTSNFIIHVLTKAVVIFMCVLGAYWISSRNPHGKEKGYITLFKLREANSEGGVQNEKE